MVNTDLNILRLKRPKVIEFIRNLEGKDVSQACQALYSQELRDISEGVVDHLYLAETVVKALAYLETITVKAMIEYGFHIREYIYGLRPCQTDPLTSKHISFIIRE